MKLLQAFMALLLFMLNPGTVSAHLRGFNCETMNPNFSSTNEVGGEECEKHSCPFVFRGEYLGNHSYAFSIWFYSNLYEGQPPEIFGAYMKLQVGRAFIGEWTANQNLHSVNNCSEPGLVVLGNVLNKTLGILTIRPEEQKLIHPETSPVRLFAVLSSQRGFFWYFLRENPYWLQEINSTLTSTISTSTTSTSTTSTSASNSTYEPVADMKEASEYTAEQVALSTSLEKGSEEAHATYVTGSATKVFSSLLSLSILCILLNNL